MKKGLGLLFAASIFTSGCSTAVNHLGTVHPYEGNNPPKYSGVLLDVRLLNRTQEPPPKGPRLYIVGYSILDMPFSAIGDTVLLPLDMAKSDSKPQSPQKTKPQSPSASLPTTSAN